MYVCVCFHSNIRCFLPHWELMKISIFSSKWNLSMQIFSKFCFLLINFWLTIYYFLRENKRWLLEDKLWLCKTYLMHQIVSSLLLSAWVQWGIWRLDSHGVKFPLSLLRQRMIAYRPYLEENLRICLFPLDSLKLHVWPLPW